MSLVGLNEATDVRSMDDGESLLKPLGGTSFYEMVSHFRDIGILHEYPARSSPLEDVRLSEPRFWTSLTLEEAQTMADSLNFSLDKYIL